MCPQPFYKHVPIRVGFFTLVVGFCLVSLMAVTTAPRAYAATTARADTVCTVRGAFQDVYDSYNHDEGVISLHHNYCDNTTWATFLSNTNTWQTVQVTFQENLLAVPNTWPPSTIPGFGNEHTGPVNTWQPNTNFDSPKVAGAACFMDGYVVLVDNRGNTIVAYASGQYTIGYCFNGM